VLLDKLGVLGVFLSESSGELGDENAGNGESGEKRPTTFPFSLEEHWPWIEQPHLSLFLFLFSLVFSLNFGIWMSRPNLPDVEAIKKAA
jgi:hypothetical protein